MFAVAGFLWLRDGRPAPDSGPHRAGLYVGALVAFMAATLVFGVSAEPFRDPRFLGHQLRELVTHTLVTLPLALGTCFALARRIRTCPRRTRARRCTHGRSTQRRSLPSRAGAFVLIASVLLKAQTYGQTTSLAALLFPHFFEHSLGYAFTSALAGFLYLLPTRKGP